MNTTLYVGPVATALDGVDLAWLVGLLVPALSYFWLMKLGKRAPVLKQAS
jgi:NCS1 family nucleobase:cation symporter-1